MHAALAGGVAEAVGLDLPAGDGAEPVRCTVVAGGAEESLAAEVEIVVIVIGGEVELDAGLGAVGEPVACEGDDGVAFVGVGAVGGLEVEGVVTQDPTFPG